jgi:hypothetical protein
MPFAVGQKVTIPTHGEEVVLSLTVAPTGFIIVLTVDIVVVLQWVKLLTLELGNF